MNDSSSISRRRFLGAGATAVATSTLGASVLRAASTPKRIPIFNGRNLEGWHPNPKRIGHGTGGRWTVKDGVLTCEQEPPGSGNGGLLLTDEKYADFDLQFDLRPEWGPDSGVFFRCTEKGEGFQMYVDYHANGNVGHLRGEMPGSFALKPFQINAVSLDGNGQPTGFATQPDGRALKWPEGVYEYTCTAEQWLKAWKLNDWNTARIRCVGKYPKITTWINSLRICEFNGETCPLPGYDKERVFGILGREGSIGLQIHGGTKAWPEGTRCHWRNIGIRRL